MKKIWLLVLLLVSLSITYAFNSPQDLWNNLEENKLRKIDSSLESLWWQWTEESYQIFQSEYKKTLEKELKWIGNEEGKWLYNLFMNVYLNRTLNWDLTKEISQEEQKEWMDFYSKYQEYEINKVEPKIILLMWLVDKIFQTSKRDRWENYNLVQWLFKECKDNTKLSPEVQSACYRIYKTFYNWDYHVTKFSIPELLKVFSENNWNGFYYPDTFWLLEDQYYTWKSALDYYMSFRYWADKWYKIWDYYLTWNTVARDEFSDGISSLNNNIILITKKWDTHWQVLAKVFDWEKANWEDIYYVERKNWKLTVTIWSNYSYSNNELDEALIKEYTLENDGSRLLANCYTIGKQMIGNDWDSYSSDELLRYVKPWMLKIKKKLPKSSCENYVNVITDKWIMK